MSLINESNRKWWVLFTTCLLVVMLNIDVTAVNLAIPAIAHQLHANLANMQWVINAFVLLPAMFTILGGQLGVNYGNRYIFIIATFIFILGSGISGLAFNEASLISGRAVQGFSLGIGIPAAMALIYAAFPAKEYGIATSFVVGTMGLSLALGPPIGGIITHYFGWRWIFLVNIPIGILTVLLAFITCSQDKVPQKQPLDYWGTLFLILGLFGFILALNQSQIWGLDSAKFLVSLVGGIIALVLLYFIERKQENPLLDFGFFKNRNFLLNNILRIIVQVVFIPILFFVPIYLQNISGYTALFAGNMMLFLTLILGLSSPFMGKWVDISGDKIPNLITMILFAIICLLFYFLQSQPNLILLSIALFLVGVATSIGFVATTTGAVSTVPTSQTGVASGIIITIGWSGCAIGIAAMGGILAITGKAMLLNELAQMPLTLTSEQLSVLIRAASGVAPLTTLQNYFPPTILPELQRLTANTFMYGFSTAMMVWFIVSIIGIILSLLLKNKFQIENEK